MTLMSAIAIRLWTIRRKANMSDFPIWELRGAT
jgi:hypothetical protein